MEFELGIIGIGAAGSHLLHALLDDPELSKKSIVVIDREDKNTNDRTWSFWELSKGYWDELVYHRWEKGAYIATGLEKGLTLSPYVYKMLRSIDFYTHTKARLENAPNVHRLQSEVKSVGNVGGRPIILLENGDRIAVDYLFDSRVDKRFYQPDDAYFRVWQHFKGWVINSESPVFNPDEFIMMDFRIKYRDETSFMYILPFSEHRALVEFTFFSPEVREESVYDSCIARYLEEILGVQTYQLEETESGVIPMTDYPFHRLNSDTHIRIGTAGSWVKGSSGYSFKSAEKKARMIVANLKAGRKPGTRLISVRHRFYDSIFLDLLYRQNHLGESLFTSMYTRNEVQTIFRFLDEETTYREELAIISSFSPGPFLSALGRHIVRRFFLIK